MRFYAKGPEKRVLCIQREDVRLLAATGEHDPSRTLKVPVIVCAVYKVETTG